MSKQTAVEWLVNVVQSCIAPNYIPKEIIDQAKAMHKEEIIDAWLDGEWWDSEKDGEQYYNETYGGQDEK